MTRSSARQECNHVCTSHARPTCMPLARMLLGAALPVAIAGGYDFKRDASARLNGSSSAAPSFFHPSEATSQ